MTSTAFLSIPTISTFSRALRTRPSGCGMWGSGNALRLFTGHTSGVTAVSCSPDGKTLASADDSGAIHSVESREGQAEEAHARTRQGRDLESWLERREHYPRVRRRRRDRQSMGRAARDERFHGSGKCIWQRNQRWNQWLESRWAPQLPAQQLAKRAAWQRTSSSQPIKSAYFNPRRALSTKFNLHG